MGLVGGQVPLRDGSLGATQTNAVFTSVCVFGIAATSRELKLCLSVLQTIHTFKKSNQKTGKDLEPCSWEQYL